MSLVELEVEWLIRKCLHPAFYRRAYPLSELDEVILMYLRENEDSTSYREMGIDLGFAIESDIENEVQYDVAEVEVFEKILDTLTKFHLIDIFESDNDVKTITITDWGIDALNTNLKYLFFEGDVDLNDIHQLHSPESIDQPFPFYKYDIISNVDNENEIEPFVYNPQQQNENFFLKKAKLSCLKSDLPDSEKLLFDWVEEDVQRYKTEIVNLTLKLIKRIDDYDFTIAINGKNSPELRRIISYPENFAMHNEWLLQLRWAYHLEKAKVLLANEIEPYLGFIDWPIFLTDKRIEWNSSLFDILTNPVVNRLSTWNAAIDNCPTMLITENLERYRDYWSWDRLSAKLSADFIINHINQYPWNISQVLDKLDQQQIEKVLLSIKSIDDLGSIDDLAPLVSKQFLSEHLRDIPFNLALIPSWGESQSGEFIIANPDLEWSYSHITNSFSFGFLAEHIDLFGNYLDINGLLKRIVQTEVSFNNALEYSAIFDQIALRSQEITLRIAKEDDVYLSVESIGLLEKYEALFWGNENVPGVESNINFTWTRQSFELYRSKVKSKRAFENISNRIDELEVVIDNPDFEWRYEVLSSRSDLKWDIKFLTVLKAQLNFTSIINSVTTDLFKENLAFFHEWSLELEKKESLQCTLSLRLDASTSFQILSELFELELLLNWDEVLGKDEESILDRLVAENADNIVSSNFSDQILSVCSQKCSVNFILANTELQWDWKFVTSTRLSSEQLGSEDFKERFAPLLYWPHIIRKYYEAADLFPLSKLALLASLIDKGNAEFKEETWSEVTKKFPANKLWKAIDETKSIDFVRWDWDYISSSEFIPIDERFLSDHADSINWDTLSSNRNLSSFFFYSNSTYRNHAEWIEFVIKYLDNFRVHWNFKKLSSTNSLTWHDKIIAEFEDLWDWSILSKQSKFLTNFDKATKRTTYLIWKLKRFSERIDFQEISTRHDVTLETVLVKEFIDKDWNWTALSSHPLFEIEPDFVKEYSEKPWDFELLTTVHIQVIDKSLLLELSGKNWNWEYLSSVNWLDNDTVVQLNSKDWDLKKLAQNKCLIFDKNLLEIFSDKGFTEWGLVLARNELHINRETIDLISSSQGFSSRHWRLLSKHKNLSFNQDEKLLERNADDWSWEELILHKKLNLEDIELLRKYQEYLIWDDVIKSEMFVPTSEVLNEFKDRLDWRFLSDRIDLEPKLLREFRDYLDWSLVSSNTHILFTTGLIDSFKYDWDYFSLLDNPALNIKVREYIESIIESIPDLELYLKIRSNCSKWAGSVYHFTHISNALQIISSQKILSRNRAVGHADAAGSVVSRRDDAHDFARFYFRPQTPTQFYNEALGKDISSGYLGSTQDNYGNWSQGWKSSFPQAMALGLPKCPVPIFFKFDLQEIILKNKKQCFISNGNMQTNWASAGPISKMLSKFNFRDLYSTIRTTSDGSWQTYINYSQQEFLVPQEFDFTGLKNYSIIVPNVTVKNQLLRVFNNDPVLSRRIFIDSYEFNVFHNENKKLEYEIEDDVLNIWTDYKGDGYSHGKIVLESNKEDSFTYLSGNVIASSKRTLEAYPDIKVRVDPTAIVSFKFYDDFKDIEYLILETSLGKNSQAHNLESSRSIADEKASKELIFDNPQLLINGLMNLSSELKTPFLRRVRHYFLKEHSLLVLNSFEKYFGKRELPIDRNLFRLFLALHDIGKPVAIDQGDKSLQYQYTQAIVKNIWPQLPFDGNDLDIVLALSEGDYVGEYMQGKIDLESVLSSLKDLARLYKINSHELGLLYMVYYQSDIAAYTADAGGIPFLENLFEYNAGQKVMEEGTGFIKLSSKPWDHFFKLFNAIVQ